MYSPEIIDNFLVKQKEYIKNDKCEDKNKNAALILDECLYDNKLWANENIKSIFMNGRHIAISVLLATHSVMNITPLIRSNLDYIFIFQGASDKKKLFELYGGMFPTFEIFTEVLDKCTISYGCMVIKITDWTETIENQV